MNEMTNLLAAFKAFTETDQAESRRLLEEEGYDVNALVPKVAFFIDELRAQAKLRLAIASMSENHRNILRMTVGRLMNVKHPAIHHEDQKTFMWLTGFTNYHFTYPLLANEILTSKFPCKK